MILFYVMGGGLGHLSRCEAFIHTQGLQSRDYRIWSPSPRAAELFEPSRLILPPSTSDPKELRQSFEALLERESFSEIYVDVFPAGILGELCGWEGQELHLIGRHLKWEEYKKRISGPLPPIGRVYACEELHPDQVAAMNFRELVPLELHWPSALPSKSVRLPDHCWLVVHSGPEEEVRALYDYARKLVQQQVREAAFVIVGDAGLDRQAFPGAELHSLYPAWPLFEQAEMVITAGGFNSMAQMRGMEGKHVCLPFFRVLDDQGRRVGRGQ